MPQPTAVNPELKPSTPAQPAGPLPHGYPAWAAELADLYFSGTTCVFVLYGNVHDLVRLPGDEIRYCELTEFLATQVFGRWDLALCYDLSRGLRPVAGQDADRLRAMSQFLVGRWGEPLSWPRDPEKLLLGLDAFVERNLMEDPSNRKSVAVIFDYAQYILPAG